MESKNVCGSWRSSSNVIVETLLSEPNATNLCGIFKWLDEESEGTPELTSTELMAPFKWRRSPF